MNTNCTVMCDGCGGLVEGFVSHQDGFSGGFYLRGWLVIPNKGKQTDVFPEGKNILCDYCMQSSDAYQTVYAHKPPVGLKRAPARLPRDGEVVRSYDDVLTYIRTGVWS